MKNEDRLVTDNEPAGDDSKLGMISAVQRRPFNACCGEMEYLSHHRDLTYHQLPR